MKSRVVCVGNLVHDEVFQIDQIPGVGIKVEVRGYESRFGGPAATAAVAICHLGGIASYWGRVGSDAAGETAIRLMRAAGVDCDGVAVIADSRTLRAIVLVDRKGERCIVTDRLSLPPERGTLPDTSLDDAAVVLADTRWPKGALLGLQRAREAGVPTVLDVDGGLPSVNAEMVALADHVVFSSQGLHEFAGEGDLATLLRGCLTRPGQVLAATCGPAGSLWLIDGEIVPVPAFAMAAIDTTGCGDVFHGAYALGLAEGQQPLEAARFAAAVAAIKAARGQGWDGMGDRAAVLALMAEQPADRARS
ncbi:MAG: PfkB family carbohydrate kinase [Geminicoccaceae bacterium]